MMATAEVAEVAEVAGVAEAVPLAADTAVEVPTASLRAAELERPVVARERPVAHRHRQPRRELVQWRGWLRLTSTWPSKSIGPQ